MLRTGLILLLLAPVLSAQEPVSPRGFTQALGTPASEPAVASALLTFEVCLDRGCRTRQQVTIRPADWQRVRSVFLPAPDSPAAERRCVEQALAAIERIVGPLTDTADDVGGWEGNFKGTRPPSGRQQDCLDEAANATTYLGLLALDGLLRFHQPRAQHAERRQHWAGSMVETATGEVWAVDSWVHDNGQPAQVQRFSQWRRGRDYLPE